MAKEIRPLFHINPETGAEEIFYPATTSDSVFNPANGFSITKELATIVDKAVELGEKLSELDDTLGKQEYVKEYTNADYSNFVVNTSTYIIGNASSVYSAILIELHEGQTFRVNTNGIQQAFTTSKYPQVGDGILRSCPTNQIYKVAIGEKYLLVNCAVATFTSMDVEFGNRGLVKDVEGIQPIVESLEPFSSIDITTLYSTITKQQIFQSLLGTGLTQEKLSDGSIKISKASGIGSDSGAWSGFYASLDFDNEFITGHDYLIGFDISLNAYSLATSVNPAVRIAKASISPDTDATKVNSILYVGRRSFVTYSFTKTKEGEYVRMLYQIAKLYTADSFELILHGFYVVDLTENDITLAQAVEYLKAYKRQRMSLVNNSMNAITAEYARHFEGDYKEARYKGKYGVLMGDSHTTRRAQWITKVFNRMGAIHNETLNAYIVGKSTNEVADGYEDTCTPLMSQATRLIEKYNQGEKVDIVFIENVHYYFRDHTFDNASPFKPTQIIQLGDYAQNVSEEPAWFTTNINTLLSGKIEKLGTLLKYTFRANCSKLTFSGTPKAGTITITFRGKNYPTTLSGKETLSEAVALIFVNFNNLSYDKATLNGNTITFVPNDGVYQHTITINAGATGLTATQTQESGSPTSVYRYFDSRNIADWNTASHWYRLDYWNYGFGYFKGVIETLLEAIPNLEIIMLGLANTSPAQGQYTDDLGMNVVEWMSSRSRTREGQTTQLSIGKNYNLKTIDVDGLSGINSSNWFEFYNYGDVHPKPNGYERWADTIIRELGV